MLILALLIPIILTCLVTQILYWSGSSVHSPWMWLQIAISMTMGVVFIGKIPSLSKSKRALIALVYLPIIYVVVELVGLTIACFNGDCWF
jgi:hypothetical protein